MTPGTSPTSCTRPAEGPPKPPFVVHVGVTGHRHDDLADCDLDAIRTTVCGVLQRVRATGESVHAKHAGDFAPEPPIFRCFSRLADGSDLLVAEEALNAGFELWVVFPFTASSYAQYIHEAWRAAWTRARGAATQVLELDGDPGTPDKRAPDISFVESRRMVLRQSDLLIAIWDADNRPSGVWGTTTLVSEARHDDLLVVHVPPRTPDKPHLDTCEDCDTVNANITALEVRIEQLLAPPRTAATTHRRHAACWPPTPVGYDAFQHERQRSWTVGSLWSTFRDLWYKARVAPPQFRVENYLSHAAREWEAGWNASPRLPETVCRRIDEVLLVPFAWADKVADHYAGLTRSAIVVNYLLAATAVLFAVLAQILHGAAHHPSRWATAATCAELACVVLIVGNLFLARRGRWHERWIDYRVLAERIRLQRFLAPLGRVVPHTRRPAHLTFGDVRDTWMAWYSRALSRSLGFVAARFDADYVRACRATMLMLVADDEGGQVPWHMKNAERLSAVEEHLEAAGIILFGVAALACATHLTWPTPWLTLATAALPAFGASLAAIAVHTQLGRVAKHSRSMSDRLSRLAESLRNKQLCSREIAAPCEAIAEAMTSEVLDWRSLFRGTIAPPA